MLLRSTLRSALRIAPPRHAALRACSANATSDIGHQGGPTALYQAAVARNEINADEDQVAALKLLQRVHDGIVQALAEGNEPHANAAVASADGTATSSAGDGGGGGGWFSSLFGGGENKAGASTGSNAAAGRAPGVRGVYLWGGVGCGKTYIMDLLHEAAPTARKRRAHFHSFMLDVHNRMHKLRRDGVDGDPIPIVAAELATDAWLLCFDEFQVTDVADALILRRLFSAMLDLGVVVVATSNRPPEDLYKNGVQREHFLPFIDALKQECDVYAMVAHTDYRLVKGMGEADRVMLQPLTGTGSKEARAAYENLWQRTTEGAAIGAATLMALGHEIHVPEAAHQRNTARFAFGDLCEKALGAADYLTIARAYHTVFLHDVPVLSLQEHGRDKVRRFITLIDTLYDAGVKLVMLAGAEPLELFHAGDGGAETDETDEAERAGASDGATNSEEAVPTFEHDETFAFDRTVSRLMEMSSSEYLERPVKVLTGPEFIKQFEVQRLSDTMIRRVWDRYDADGSGDLDRRELRAVMEDVTELKLGHRNVPDGVVDAVFSSMDANADGQVEWEEFLIACREYGIGYGDVWAVTPKAQLGPQRTKWIPGVTG